VEERSNRGPHQRTNASEKIEAHFALAGLCHKSFFNHKNAQKLRKKQQNLFELFVPFCG
jgi:hypothetical protein